MTIKKHTLQKHLTFLLLVIVFFTMFSNLMFTISSTENSNSIQYTISDPIEIDGEIAFRATAQTKGWSGDGTSQSPIIIDGLQIVGDFSKPLISIKNSQLFFNLQNCVLTRGTIGILLEDISKASILKNVIIDNSIYGIKGSSFNGSLIKNNLISNNNIDGIFFDGVVFVVIVCNQISDNTGYGINVQAGEDLNITKNNFEDNNIGDSSQALDAGVNNEFKNNYWSDWTNTGSYQIDGSSNNADLVPLDTEVIFDVGTCGGSPPTRPTDITKPSSFPSSTSFSPIIILYLASICIGIFGLYVRKRRN